MGYFPPAPVGGAVDVDSPVTFSPGTAPSSIRGNKSRWFPHDFDDRAKPYGSMPSLTIADATTEACWRMGRAGVVQEFLPGTYWFSGTYAPSGRDGISKKKTVFFNDTTLRLHTSSTLSRVNSINGWLSFAEVTRQANIRTAPQVSVAGGAPANYPHLGAATQGNDNLPPPQNLWVFFDVSYTDRSQYFGTVTLHGGPNLTGLCAWGASNEYHTNGEGGGGSKYAGEVIITGGWHIGWIGSPKYNDARERYPDPFVGCQIMRVRIDREVEIGILAGGNTFDDMVVGELNVIGNGGTARPFSGCSYLFGTALECGTIYSNGFNSKYIFDVMQSEFSWKNFYLEDAPGQSGVPAAAIIKRNEGFLHGRCKLGATSSTTTGGFVHDMSDGGGGELSGHERMGDIGTAHAIVVLQARTNSRRVYKVTLPYPETGTSTPRGLPFRMLANGAQVSANDELMSWAPRATSGATSGMIAAGVRWEHLGAEGVAGSIAGTGGLKRRIPAYTT